LKARKRKTGKLNGNNQKVELKKKSPMEGHQRGIKGKNLTKNQQARKSHKNAKHFWNKNEAFPFDTRSKSPMNERTSQAKGYQIKGFCRRREKT